MKSEQYYKLTILIIIAQVRICSHSDIYQISWLSTLAVFILKKRSIDCHYDEINFIYFLTNN